jgi:hypothetical protein
MNYNQKLWAMILMIRLSVAALVIILSAIFNPSTLLHTLIVAVTIGYATYHAMEAEKHWDDKVE